MYAPRRVGLCIVMHCLCPFLFCNHLDQEEGAGCFALIGPRREKIYLQRFANNKGIRAVRSAPLFFQCLESIISRLATKEISIF